MKFGNLLKTCTLIALIFLALGQGKAEACTCAVGYDKVMVGPDEECSVTTGDAFLYACGAEPGHVANTADCRCFDNYTSDGYSCSGPAGTLACASRNLAGASFINGGLVATSTGVPLPGNWQTGDPIPAAATATATGTSATIATAPIATAVTTATAVALETIANTTSGDQGSTLDAAANISDSAASNRGTIAAANCAQGANDELAAAGSGAEAVASCQDDFAKAKELANMAAKGGKDGTIKADQGVLASEDVQSIFSKFEKNFGVSRDDYLSRMLNSRGSLDEFKDMLSTKFTDDKFEKMMAAAGEAKPVAVAAAESGVVEATASSKKKPTDTSLKDYLKKKLLVATPVRDLASSKIAGSKSVPDTKFTNLKPSGLDQIIYGNQEQESELTLFDIIHMKLRDFTARQRL